MITLEEFERAQGLLGRRAHPQDESHENPLAGLIRCGYCGCSIVAEFHTKRGKTYVYYRCARSKPGIRCREKPISEAMLKLQLAGYFRRLVIPEPILAFLRGRLDRLDAAHGATSEAVIEQRERALKALEQEERELLGLRIRRQIDDAVFEGERKALQQRRLELVKETRGPEGAATPQQTRAKELQQTLCLTDAALPMVSQGPSVQVRSLLLHLQLNLTLRGRRVDFTAPKPLSDLIAAGANSNWYAKWPALWKWIVYGDVSESAMPSEEECRVMMTEQGVWRQGG